MTKKATATTFELEWAAPFEEEEALAHVSSHFGFQSS